MSDIIAPPPAPPVSPFYYQLVELPTQPTTFMPQRGVLTEDQETLWFDGVPQAAPTIELAKEWLKSMAAFDAKRSEGKVVYVLGISPD